jgi:type IX secretion system PorP/SprF family membrane protein
VKEKFYLLLIAFFMNMLLLLPSAIGQDIHFSQFHRSPLNLNPALTGVSPSDFRVMGNFRSQWTSVPVSYRTYSVAFDQVVYPRWESSTRFAYGLLLDHDIAGDSKLSNTLIAALGSTTVQLSPRQFVTAGIQLGLFQRSINTGALEFDRQYRDGTFDPGNPNGESFNDLPNMLSFDFGAGINWHHQASGSTDITDRTVTDRTKFDLGVGLYHITRPKQSFLDKAEVGGNNGDVMLDYRWSMYGMSVFQVDKDIDVLVNAMWQMQGKFDQVVPMAGVRFHINQTPTRNIALDLAVAYRFFNNGDAVVPQATVHYRDLIIGLSYDITLSEFNQANNYYGGPEISVVYGINRVVPGPVKFCPIF